MMGWHSLALYVCFYDMRAYKQTCAFRPDCVMPIVNVRRAGRSAWRPSQSYIGHPFNPVSGHESAN
jgi:hypothetical protein